MNKSKRTENDCPESSLLQVQNIKIYQVLTKIQNEPAEAARVPKSKIFYRVVMKDNEPKSQKKTEKNYKKKESINWKNIKTEQKAHKTSRRSDCRDTERNC